MKYKLILLFLVLLSISVSAAITRECIDRVKPNMNCSIVSNAGTPCSGDYVIINATEGNGAEILTGPVLTLNSTYGLCYFTFNQTAGDYIAIFNNTNETRKIVVDGNTNEQIIIEVDSVEENQATISSYIGDPSGNSTSLWDYMYCSAANFNSDTCMFYRNWVLYPFRTTSGVRT